MILKNNKISFTQVTCLVIYYCLLQFLPASTIPVFGRASKKLRYFCCKHIFKYCGKNVNIERRAVFGIGINVCIGDNSGIGINCLVPGDIIIGKNVMMGPKCYILGANHAFNRCDIPMIEQGHAQKKQTIIEDDVWIGRQVVFTPGRTVKKGSIIAIACVLTKDFPEYSVVGGNPSRLIRSRIDTYNS